MGEIKDALELLQAEVAETAAAVGRCVAKVQELLTQIEEGKDVSAAVAEAKVQLDALQAAVDAVAPPPVVPPPVE